MKDMINVLHIILSELESLTLDKILLMVVYISIGWFISKFAKRTFFKLIWIGFAFYLIIGNTQVSSSILFDEDTLFGIGFILPHAKFIFEFLANIYNSIKNAIVNIYYFIITIYFKIIKLILFFYDLYKKIKSFFNEKEANSTNNNQSNYYEKQEYSSSFKQEQKSSRKNRNHSKKSHNDSKKNNEQSSSSSNNKHKDHLNNNPYESEFKQFFSHNSYVVLGVTKSDTKASIKKAYRKLVMKYHPDINSSHEVEKYTNICQLINKAYEDIG